MPHAGLVQQKTLRVAMKAHHFTRKSGPEGLGIVARAVSTRSTLPVPAIVLVATDNGRLKPSATNLEIVITCWIDATVEEEGPFHTGSCV